MEGGETNEQRNHSPPVSMALRESRDIGTDGNVQKFASKHFFFSI